ncbi:S-layer protein [Planctomyces sp. SCGC AG-212-M04]|nr:S-layer protein [Planctomyces sp. SCGC AG-212-M04]
MIAFGADETTKEAPPPAPAVTFEADIQPLFTRLGCNAGACHGKSRGQNGFALSLLAFDQDFDYASIVQEGRGRRIFPSAPEQSLLLQKAAGKVPHGGGKRVDVGSPHYELIRTWIQNGAPRTPADAPTIVRVVVEPATKQLAPGGSVQLKAIAEYTDGHRRDVTSGCAFQSNDRTVATVSEDGLLKAGALSGETAVMARYVSHIAVATVTIPLPGQVPDEVYAKLPRNNEIDDLVWKKLKTLGMLPSEPVDDAKFHRRAFLRAIGRLPSVEETREFLADTSADKRARLIDRLLERPEYGDFWANKWADLLRPNPYRAGIKAVWNMDAFLRESFRTNKPYDQFVRELVTAQGSTWKNGATVMFRDRPSPVEIGSSVSQLFLGVRLECAKCHHHPFEIWSQDDFYGFASFFARVGHNGGISPPISGGEEIIYTLASGTVPHGRTGAAVEPKTLNGESLKLGPEEEPREVLANWMTSDANPWFAKVMANRVWAEIMGVGIVEPIDDLRATNPPSNEALLNYLADDFRASGYNIKHLIRRIMTSQVFGLSSTPSERNVSDLRNFSRYYRQRMRAEVLLDGVNDALGVEETFEAMPPGSRATQLWTHRSSSLFLDTFGRPDPNQDPPCERTTDVTTPQVLHLMNSPALNDKLSKDDALPAKLVTSDRPDEQLIEEVFLRVYCRVPTQSELATAKELLSDSKEKRARIEDLFWALLNTPEFYFID